MSSEERLIELEIKTAHQEVTIQELREALDQHHHLIEGLKAQLKKLESQVKNALEGEEVGPHQQKPPHY